MNNVLKNELHPRWKGGISKPIHEYICVWCSKKFYSSENKPRIYCSNYCSGFAKTGENGRAWKHGYKTYRKWGSEFNSYLKEHVKVRDGFACVSCGAIDKRLDVHHKDGNTHYNDPDNLITLCWTCHGKHHSYSLIKFMSAKFAQSH